MDNPMSLKGKRILITGASSGIGRAVAEVTAQLGAATVLVARRADKLAEVRAGLPQSTKHLICPGDVTDNMFLEELFETSTRDGRLDGIVHAAGIGPTQPIGFSDPDFVEDVHRTNALSFLQLMRLATRMKYRNCPYSVVAVSSIAALAGWSCVSTYAASKGAVSASVRALAIELAPKGIRVNAVCPGHVKTPMLNPADEKVLADLQPLGIGSPKQIADVIAFLLSDAASFITGVNLPVDGGYSAR